jgi:hypothetical protein
MDEDLQRPEGELVRKSAGNFFSRLGWLFFSPSKLYADIGQRSSWWQPWVWVSVFGMIGVYIAHPITVAVIKLNPRNLDPEQLQQTLDALEKFAAVGYLLAPISSLFQALIVAAIGYVVLTIIVEGVDFKRYFTLYLYSNIVVTIGSLLSSFLVRQRGADGIQRTEDAVVSFGLDFLVPEGNKALTTLASSINVFTIWSLVIIALGVMHIFGATRNQGIVAAIPVWLVYVAFGMLLSLIPSLG